MEHGRKKGVVGRPLEPQKQQPMAVCNRGVNLMCHWCVSVEIHFMVLHVPLHTLCTMMSNKNKKNSSEIRSIWMRLFVRDEMDVVRRRLPADPVSVWKKSSGCGDLSVQGRGSIYLFMVLQPLDCSFGASLLRVCYFFVIAILILLFFKVLFSTLSRPKHVRFFPPWPREKRLTCSGHFILVCNIVNMLIPALYRVTRL